ncbi:MAG: hypothetical protein WKH68_12500 [Candidatus Limnocylindria bacterium]
MLGRRPMTVLLIAVAASLGVAGSGASPASAAGKNCSPPRYPGSGYFTSLKVTAVSCGRGREVALAHYRCRVKNGRTGKCAGRSSGFRCSEKRTSISTELNSLVTCRRGDTTVRFSYQQNT